MRELIGNDADYIYEVVMARSEIFKDAFGLFDDYIKSKDSIQKNMFDFTLRFFEFEDKTIIGTYNYKRPYTINCNRIIYINNIRSEEISLHIKELCEFINNENKRVKICIKDSDLEDIESDLVMAGFTKEIIYENELKFNQSIIQYVYN